MQLKIEKKKTHVIVHIDGEIAPKEVRAIYDALKSAFAVSRAPLILNLSTAKAAPNVLANMMEFHLIALRANSDLLIVGSSSISQFPNIAVADKLLASGSPLHAFREKSLTSLLDHLEQKVAAQTKQLSELEAQYLSKQNLPQEIESMKTLLGAMTKQAEEILKQLIALEKEHQDEEAVTELHEIERKMLKIVREGSFKVSG